MQAFRHNSPFRPCATSQLVLYITALANLGGGRVKEKGKEVPYMRRIKVILAVIAVVATLMVLAARAMADSEISSSGGNSVGSFDGGSGGVFTGDVGGDIVLGPNIEIG